jgi:hypothetical protein
MAGDGDRAPDVSEQRADVICGMCGSRCMAENCDRYAPVSDPASVLAALLAESPEATVAALEALLTSDEAVGTASAKALYPVLHAVSLGDSPEALLGHAVHVTLDAAVRSLLSRSRRRMDEQRTR